MIHVREYVDANGHSPFGNWFNSLNIAAAAKVATALERMALGHTSSFKAVGEGVSEYKIDFGPGYRIYVGRDGEAVIILVGGGSKKRQQRDIEKAKVAWNAYKTLRREHS